MYLPICLSVNLSPVSLSIFLKFTYSNVVFLVWLSISPVSVAET